MQKTKNIFILITLKILLITICLGIVLLIAVPKHTVNMKKSDIRLGVTEGIPFVIGSEFSNRYGNKYVDINKLDIYTFQDC